MIDFLKRLFGIAERKPAWMNDHGWEVCKQVKKDIPASAIRGPKAVREQIVRDYYRDHPDRHDAAFVADRVGLTVGHVHDLRAGRS